MPCSPVMLPPSSTQARRISCPAGEDAPHLVGVALVVEQDRVDVAVAGVEDVGDAQAVALADGGDGAQDVGHLGARHDAVLRAVVRRQPADRAEGALAALPQRRALGLVAPRRAPRARRCARQTSITALRLLIELRRRAVELDDEHRAGVGRKAEVERRLDRLRR